MNQLFINLFDEKKIATLSSDFGIKDRFFFEMFIQPFFQFMFWKQKKHVPIR